LPRRHLAARLAKIGPARANFGRQHATIHSAPVQQQRYISLTIEFATGSAPAIWMEEDHVVLCS
jgi:hypothetical protein